jgi:hypothetical protein|tara:strand:- start:682 stop:1155 length:474 start_codon:yes stop_codon:yes gene_type:complete
MKKISFCLCFFIGIFTNAQNIITTTGSDFSGDNISISYTVGQLKVNTIDNVNSSPLILDFLQGVQYGFDVYDCRDYNSISFSIYPNPTSSFVNISFEKLSDPITLRVFDVRGRLINENIFSEKITQLDMSNYSNGIYFLSFYNFCGLFRSFKISVSK